jgi:hypothetical protein
MILLNSISTIFLISSLLTGGLIPNSPALLTPNPAPGTGKIRWIVLKTSSISIAGKTNINTFCCEVNGYSGPDTLSTSNPSLSDDLQGIPLKGTLQVNIGDFNCRNNAMTNEFKKILRYHEYPQLKIVFLSLEKMPAFNNNGEIVKGFVNVQLAGQIKRFEISYTSRRTIDGDLQLVGTKILGFSDFGLIPPRKLGGLIRVNDNLNVQFHLCLQPSI